MLASNDIRRSFLDFFAGRGHRIQPGISLVPTDPSLFLTAAGVVPFRAVIEGREPAPHPRVATCQRCMRTGDIENVGKFARYHTFFEMLGNFSFGDYYKRESLEWGWEFLTGQLGLDPNRLWATIYPDDEEAFQIWTRQVGLPADRVIRLKDNFWGPVAETGACGPDSEVYFDFGPAVGCGNPDCRPGCDCDRYMEFWNHVFTELDKQPDGSFKPLPQRNIDTGMGLERLTCIVQGVQTVFDTDLFAPLLDRLEALLQAGGLPAGDRSDWRKRTIADHCRALCFLIMDGVYPANVGRGYIVRRVLRRAATFGRLLGIEGPFLHEMVPVVVVAMAGGYPELEPRSQVICETVRREEQTFADALSRGMPRLLEALRHHESGMIAGPFAFRLWDTYGIPLDLQQEVAAEFNVVIDEEGFRVAENEARSRSREAQVHQRDLGDSLDWPPTRFAGYELTDLEAQVIGLIKDGEKVDVLQAGEEGSVVLDETPFYAESGGQIGDTGRLAGGPALARVLDTQRQHGVILHTVLVEEGLVHAGMRLRAEVDAVRRAATARAHTATHLLHAALRQALGEHVVQRGSVVEPDRLRFDFAHQAAVGPRELAHVEQLANEQVLRDTHLVIEEMAIARAREIGAMALFGEKYGDVVRVVQIPGYSAELCGGTHVARTGAIGLVKITSESSVAAGVRRIDAATGLGCLAHTQALAHRLQEAAQELGGAPEQLVERIRSLKDHVTGLRRQLAEARQSAAGGQVDQYLASSHLVSGISLVAATADCADAEAAKSLVDRIAERLGSGVVVIGAEAEGKVVLFGKVSPDWVERGIHAGNLVREAARIAGGGGGGRPDFAQAGGRDPERLEAAIDAVPRLLLAQAAPAGAG